MNADQYAHSACMTLYRMYDEYGKYLQCRIAFEDLQVFDADSAGEVIVALRDVIRDVEYGRSSHNLRNAFVGAHDAEEVRAAIVEYIQHAIDDLEHAVAC